MEKEERGPAGKKQIKVKFVAAQKDQGFRKFESACISNRCGDMDAKLGSK
jgi:hypothetical protein